MGKNFTDGRGTIHNDPWWTAERIQRVISNLGGRNTLCLRAVVEYRFRGRDRKKGRFLKGLSILLLINLKIVAVAPDVKSKFKAKGDRGLPHKCH